MQQIQKKIYEKAIIAMTGTSWVAGLLLAGSDSPHMPWINGIGLLLFFGASILMGKQIKSADLNKRSAVYSGKYPGSAPSNGISRTKRRRINVQYALEI